MRHRQDSNLCGFPQEMSSGYFPNGIDHPFIDFAAIGIAILGQLLHLRQALEAVPSQATYQMVWVAQLRRSYAFADRHVAAERVALQMAALPPGWVLAWLPSMLPLRWLPAACRRLSPQLPWLL